MSDRGLTAEIIRDRAGLLGLQPDWDALFGSIDAEPSTSFEWTLALLDSHLREGDTALTCVIRRRGEVVAIAPMLIRRERLVGPWRVRTLRFLSELDGTHSDMAAERGNAELFTVLFQELARLPESWDMFQCSRLRSACPLANEIGAFLERAPWHFRRRREQPSYLLDLSGNYDRFLAQRSSKFRNFLRRRSRALEALGRIRIARAGAGLELEQAYDDLLRIEEQSWKHAHGTAISAVPRQRQYYRLLCDGLWRRRSLHLTLMYLDDRPVAYNLGLVHRGRYYYLKTSYDQRLRQASPATVFRARLVEMLIAEGVQSMDFPAEPYEWESQWTRDLQWHESVLVFRPSLRGRLTQGLIAVRDWLSPRAGGETVKFADPRAQRPSQAAG